VAADSTHRSGPRAAAPTKASYLSAHYYYGIKGRRGSKKAAVAVGHSILVIC
jgi:hypothetical protein